MSQDEFPPSAVSPNAIRRYPLGLHWLPAPIEDPVLARNKSPQTFEKRRREIEKRRKREAKMERRLERKFWKKVAKGEVNPDEDYYYYEDGDESGGKKKG